MSSYSSSPTVPIEKLDYKYVEGCDDVNELKDILSVLESGKEGHFPDLTRAAERKLLDVMPKKDKSKFLAIKYGPSREDEQNALCGLNAWLDSINDCDSNLKTKVEKIEKRNLPPVRGSASRRDEDEEEHILESKALSPQNKKRMDPKAKPFKDYYREWESYDVDGELNKIEELQDSEDTKMKEIQHRRRREHTFRELSKLNMKADEIENMSNMSRRVISENERRKGNESFKAKDFEEAVLYV